MVSAVILVHIYSYISAYNKEFLIHLANTKEFLPGRQACYSAQPDE